VRKLILLKGLNQPFDRITAAIQALECPPPDKIYRQEAAAFG
jgi:hypothetical protein